MDNKTLSADEHYLFNVDILINARTNRLALQYLLELMNSSDVVADFRIRSELPLGKTIDSLLDPLQTMSKQEQALPDTQPGIRRAVLPKSSVLPQSPVSPANPGNEQDYRKSIESPADPYGQIRAFIQDNRLVRLRANRQGKQISMPCRILNFDEASATLNVYQVDEKQVYTFRLNEIDEFL
ncbi:hypothetical protein SAMN04487895_105220 [Paenibacillus sophorae]|uniref:Uncharacterized protein n=1 Tax=Paenibacillus sophorae TaxID=1333845 RepID=A0A1H8MGT3_9BACL|nr:hypothetical protein [Paenibacillus sophorae]QWU17802.1 hypothetical protein KP014_12075 [Paenibacillus sophorae]SEO16366.1 hypothetical protein SAMN04487895_105220 [Paenibacillus sophorae]